MCISVCLSVHACMCVFTCVCAPMCNICCGAHRCQHVALQSRKGIALHWSPHSSGTSSLSLNQTLSFQFAFNFGVISLHSPCCKQTWCYCVEGSGARGTIENRPAVRWMPSCSQGSGIWGQMIVGSSPRRLLHGAQVINVKWHRNDQILVGVKCVKYFDFAENQTCSLLSAFVVMFVKVWHPAGLV